MNNINSIGDEEFTPFLHSLGVETFNKSFEWLFSDPDFGDVLRWLYNNLDHNNALTPREECRYAEIVKKGHLLSAEDLEASLNSIRETYSGICLPGDQDSIEDMKLDIVMQEERLAMLEKQDSVLNDLIRQNETTKQELEIGLIKLNAAQRQSSEDETLASQECLRLAEEVDSITDDVIDVVADALKVYGSCCKDVDVAKRFLTFGPLDTYRQSQALFRSYFDLYTTKKFDKRNDDVTDDDLRAALVEAKCMEERLSDAVFAYILSKAELSGEQAKLAFIADYNNVHPSQITACIVENQSALELLEQEEVILEQQLRHAGKHFVDSRTSLAVDTAARSALIIREQIAKDLSFLLDVSQQALAVDRLVYNALRHELRSVDELLHFAHDLRDYVVDERNAVCTVLQSMKEICVEHETAEQALETSDKLLYILCMLLGGESKDPVALAKRYNDLLNNIRELKENVLDGFANKERSLEVLKYSAQPLAEYIFDSSTKRPNTNSRGVATMTYALRTEVEGVEKIVHEASALFQTVKNGDKHNSRKLWQWFLTEPAKLFAAMKNVQIKN